MRCVRVSDYVDSWRCVRLLSTKVSCFVLFFVYFNESTLFFAQYAVSNTFGAFHCHIL